MNRIVSLLKEENLFLITSHVAPDGDNAGSCIGLVRYLKQMGKEAYYVLDDSLPTNLSFLHQDLKVYSSEEVKEQINGRRYVVFSLDCGDKSRICMKDDLLKEAKFLVNIDHHESNDYYGDFNYVMKEASSTCEMIYRLLCQTDKSLIEEKAATALYTGLCTDTGSFKYESAKVSAFEVAAGLIELGADKDCVVRNIYQSNSYNYVRMTSEVLMNLIKEGQLAYALVTRELLDKYQVEFKDLEELPANTVGIDGVEIGLLFKEKEEEVTKVSLRSKEWANVNEIAAFFGGGGHIRAAGCTIKRPSQEAVRMVLEKTREYMEFHGRNSKSA